MRKAVLLPLLAFLAVNAIAQQKKRVAVLYFEHGTVSSGAAAIFGTNVDVGRGIADLMVEKLVAGGVYGVYERKAIDKVLNEQNFSNSDRADASSAAKIGRLMGVDAIIIGSVVQFGRDDKTTQVGGGVFGSTARRYGLGGVGKRESKAVVAITARLISVDTAEVLAVGNGHGESARSGATLLGSGGGAIGGAGGVFDMTSKNFAATLIGEATNSAVAQLARNMEQQAARVPTKVVNIEGLVADVNGDSLILNVGSKAGVRVGLRLYVSRSVRTIKDPATGRVIRRVEDKVGEVVIAEVDEQSSVGKFTGDGTPKVGDTVKITP